MYHASSMYHEPSTPSTWEIKVYPFCLFLFLSTPSTWSISRKLHAACNINLRHLQHTLDLARSCIFHIPGYGPKWAPYKLLATLKLGDPSEITDRCSIRLPELPVSDTCLVIENNMYLITECLIDLFESGGSLVPQFICERLVKRRCSRKL